MEHLRFLELPFGLGEIGVRQPRQRLSPYRFGTRTRVQVSFRRDQTQSLLGLAPGIFAFTPVVHGFGRLTPSRVGVARGGVRVLSLLFTFLQLLLCLLRFRQSRSRLPLRLAEAH